MDGASRSTRPGLAAGILGAVGVLLFWAFFAGGASGSGATASLGSAALIIATLLLVGWARGAVLLPRLDRAALVAVAAGAALVVWTGLTVWWSIAGDRSFAALGKSLVFLAFAVVGLAAARRPGSSRARRRARSRGCAWCSSLLGVARKGGSVARAGRRRPCRPPPWVDRVLERSRAAGGRGSRSRTLARRVGTRALRQTGRGAPPLQRDARDPPHPVPGRACRRPRCHCTRSRDDDGAGGGSTVRAPRVRPGAARRGLGLYAARARGGRRRLVGSCREWSDPRRADRAWPRRGARCRRQGACRPTGRDTASGRRARPARLGCGRAHGGPARPGRGCREPGHLGHEPAHELGRGRQRPRPVRPVGDQQPHRLVGRGLAGVPCESRGWDGGLDVRDRPQARPGRRGERRARPTASRCSFSPRAVCRDSSLP